MLVIGAGVVGLALARLLARSDREVVVLDQAGIEHVICESGPTGGRHVWIALAETADPPVIRRSAGGIAAPASAVASAAGLMSVIDGDRGVSVTTARAVLRGTSLSPSRQTLMTNRVSALRTVLELVRQAKARGVSQ